MSFLNGPGGGRGNSRRGVPSGAGRSGAAGVNASGSGHSRYTGNCIDNMIAYIGSGMNPGDAMLRATEVGRQSGQLPHIHQEGPIPRG